MTIEPILHGTQWLAIFGIGVFVGAVNVVVGAGTLVSFPLLVLMGFPPITASISNTIGIVPGSFTGVVVYRQELRSRWSVVRMILPASIGGAIVGAGILLAFPAEVFSTVVPWLIAAGTLLVVLGPSIKKAVAQRAARELPSTGAVVSETPAQGPTPAEISGLSPAFSSGATLCIAVIGAFLLGIYGGYFSAAQGILLIGLLGVVSHLGIHELNAIKNLSVLVVNVVAAIIFLVISPELIDWKLVLLIAAGATCGGMLGGRFAKYLSERILRSFIIIVGVAVAVFMIATR